MAQTEVIHSDMKVSRSISRMTRLLLVFAAGFFLAQPSPEAIIFYATGDPETNTSQPSGDLADSGWQWTGLWGSFTGTAIAAHYFITAGHVGGQVGGVLTLNGVAHRTTRVFHPPKGDLALWQVREAFTNWAPLITQTSEVGLAAVSFGRGTQRGSAIITTVRQTRTNGWFWGSSDGRLRWGQNTIDQVASYTNDGTNDLLVLNFNSQGGANECTLSSGDSGGGIFVQSDSGWELAGINALVDGPFNTSTNGSGFQGAVFDARGLFLKTDTGWEALPTFGPENPASFYGLRLSLFKNWITGVTDSPLVLPPELLRASAPEGPYTVDSTIIPDTSQQNFVISLPSLASFFRIRDDQSTWTLSASVATNNTLVLHYYATANTASR